MKPKPNPFIKAQEAYAKGAKAIKKAGGLTAARKKLAKKAK
jgi:hypothetical protein